MVITEEGKYYKVKFEYDFDKINAIKAIPGAWYKREESAWMILKFRKKELDEFKEQFGFNDPPAPNQAPERFDLIPPLPELKVNIPLLLTPRPYQSQGIAYCLEHDRTMCGDQPGLGKTLQSIAAVIAKGNFPCLVICPATLKENWRREWLKVAGRRAMVLTDKVKTSWPTYHSVGMCDVFIVNFESLTKYFVEGFDNNDDEALKLKHVRFRENIQLFKSVIIDEAHKIRNSDTIASKLVAGISMGKPQIIALSGTFLVNQPLDLWPVLCILGLAGGSQRLFGKLADFKSRYCEVGPRRKPGNLKELNYYLNINGFYRREKHEVLKDLPPKVRNVLYCDITTRKEYDHAEQAFVSYLREIKQCSNEEIMKKLRGEFMVKMGILKNISARGKINEVKQYVDEIIESGSKVILFCYLKEMIHAIKALYPRALTIYGEDSLDARTRSVDLFQEDPSYPLIVCNYKSGGVGLTLTAASRVGFVEEPWTFADCEQCEDRAHRIGQKSIEDLESIECTYFLGADTIDDYCHDIVMNKKTLADMIHGSTERVEVNVVDALLNLFTKRKDPKKEEVF